MQNIVIRKAVLFGVLFLFGYSVFSQQGIGTNNPETSSVLEIKSNSLGVLIPRLTNSQMKTIASPADGLMVYCLDCPSLGIYTFNSTTSQFLLNGPNNELEATVPGISTVSSTITKYGKISTEVKITDTQGLPVTEKGIVYSSTNTSPILSNSTSVINYDALDNGVFSTETNGLLPETIYHIRSFATNIHGTSYGEVSTHTTPSAFVYTIVPTNQQYRLPLSQDVTIGNDYLIDWGDGSESYMIPSMSQADRNNAILHTYSSTSTVTIMVYGDLGKIIETTVNSARMIRDISNWGSATVGTKSFQNCQNLSISATNLPNLDANLAYTFSGATSFNSDISNWDTSNVTNMEGIFYGADAFNQDISKKTVTGDGASYAAWDTSSVTTMRNMFSGADAFNQPIGNWNTSSVTNMSNMFQLAAAFNQNIGSWNIDKVTSMQEMFFGATNFNGELPTNRSSGVIPVLTNMGYMFYNAPAFNQDVNVLNVTNVTYMQHAFTNARAFNNADVPLNWGSETAKITNWNNAFQGAIAFNNSGVEGWDMSSVTTMYDMFNGAEAFNQVIFSWNTSNVENLNNMFENAVAFNQNISYWCVTNITSEPYRFSTSSPLTGNNKPVWGTCPVMPAANDDFGNPYLSIASNGVIEAADSTVAGVSYLLDGEIYIVVDDAGLTAAIGANNTNNIVTTKITDMSNLFQNNTTFNLDISNWDTSNVTNMREMFRGATAFNQDIGSWDVSSVNDMGYMFYSANSFNQNLSNWNTINVTDMDYMFGANLVFNNNGAPLTFNTSSVTDMQSMFSFATAFNQDISKQEVTVNGVNYTAWDTSNVTNMRTMFWFATAFNQNIGNWNTPSVTTMHRMFANTSNFNQDISSWNTSGVTNVDQGMHYMFNGATAFNQDLSGWCVSLIPSVPNNFANGATAWILPQPVWGNCP